MADKLTPSPHSDLLALSVSNLPGIGEKSKILLEKFGITTIEDMIYSFPFRYEVLNHFTFGEKGVLNGVYETHGVIATRKGKRILKAVFKGTNGYFNALWLNFKGDYPANTLQKGCEYYLYGAVTRYEGSFAVFHPEFLKIEDIGSVRPVYSLPTGFSQTIFRKAITFALAKYLTKTEEVIPAHLLEKYCLPMLNDAITTLHNPQTEVNALEIEDKVHPAIKRFIYQECFYFQISMLLRKKSYKLEKGISFKVDKEFLNRIKEMMPFKLTNAQRRVLVEIFNDMIKPEQMNRLVQGDVGSGKTIVAFIACAVAAENGYQAAIVAPTEVLAEQHFKNMQKFFGNKYVIALMTGSVTKKNKTETKNLIASGAVNFVIGTHAVLEENVEFANLGFAVIDEQHRFGVRQRKTLMNKGVAPDILLMTATPIPRTLAMTIYGDLDVSLIDEMPPGRIACITKAYSSSKFLQALEFIKSVLDQGMRAYFVYPLIDESDKVDLKAATLSFEYIKKYFSDKKTGLLHGKMKPVEKRDTLDKFKTGELDILVSTTVIEVGVDVPEATVMVVENAERFGLAQLHQLRGRVGRNDIQSYCILVASKDISETGRKRISALVKYADGFKLAETDLEIRGQGDFFGTKQSGVPEFKYADILRDTAILQKAKQDAQEIVDDDPNLKKNTNHAIKNELIKLAGNASYLGIG